MNILLVYPTLIIGVLIIAGISYFFNLLFGDGSGGRVLGLEFRNPCMLGIHFNTKPNPQ
jgi:hypothetical protein